jgi:hypothetical protein
MLLLLQAQRVAVSQSAVKLQELAAAKEVRNRYFYGRYSFERCCQTVALCCCTAVYTSQVCMHIKPIKLV